jgi:hypothetical protein
MIHYNITPIVDQPDIWMIVQLKQLSIEINYLHVEKSSKFRFFDCIET